MPAVDDPAWLPLPASPLTAILRQALPTGCGCKQACAPLRRRCQRLHRAMHFRNLSWRRHSADPAQFRE